MEISRRAGRFHPVNAITGYVIDLAPLLNEKFRRVRVVVFVDEPELGRVQLRAPVKISADAYPDQTWEGEVDRLPTEIVSLETRRVGDVQLDGTRCV